jgi:putative ABC transport system permease protein
MFDIAFKNILRQKTRTILTTLGILIGIGAIVALGSIAEGLDAAVQSGLELTAGKITVIEKDAGMFGMMGEFDDEDVEILDGLSGVEDVVPMSYHIEGFDMSMSFSWQAIGIEPEKVEYFIGENIEFESGRKLEEGESFTAVVGKTVADNYNLEAGDFFTIKEEDFEVVGVLELTNIQDIDMGVIVPLEDIQAVTGEETYMAIYVIPDDVKDTERVAEDIEDASDRFDALTTTEMARMASTIVDQIRIFTFGIGAIAAFVGGLGVMNTMIMAVMERRREIGVMKAIGATNRMVLQQIITESAMISFLGGVGGILLGMLGALIISNVIGAGAITATVTPGLALTGLSFALFLGIIGGLYPARKAAMIDPVEALRYE